MNLGMAKAVADVNDPDEKQGGFASGDSDITGFSHMHDSGTGGVSRDFNHSMQLGFADLAQSPSLGNFPFFPQTGCPGDILDNCFFTKTDRASKRINGTVEAHPGYFAVSLNTSIHTEMTVTNHTALYRVTFSTDSSTPYQNQTALPYSPLILFDLTDLPESRINGSIDVDGTTVCISPSTPLLLCVGLRALGAKSPSKSRRLEKKICLETHGACLALTFNFFEYLLTSIFHRAGLLEMGRLAHLLAWERMISTSVQISQVQISEILVFS